MTQKIISEPLIHCTKADPVLNSRILKDSTVRDFIVTSVCPSPINPKDYYV